MYKKLVLLLMGALMAGALSGCSNYEYKDSNIKIKQYTKVEVEEPDQKTITDNDVATAIEDILYENAFTTDVDRVAQMGDIVVLDFEGSVDGQHLEAGTAENYEIEVGSEEFIDGFEDSIIGHKKGDQYEWSGSFPENYTDELSGKAVTFKITIKSVKEKKVPLLNDAFVKSISTESSTVAEYKIEIEKQLKQKAKKEYNEEIAYQAFSLVIGNTEILQYPKDDIKNAKNSIEQQYKTAADSSGMDYKEFVQTQMGYELSDFEKEIKESAKAQVKEELIIHAIAKEQNIMQEDSDVQDALNEFVKEYHYKSVEDLYEDIGEETAKEYVVAEAVKNWVGNHAKIIDS